VFLSSAYNRPVVDRVTDKFASVCRDVHVLHGANNVIDELGCAMEVKRCVFAYYFVIFACRFAPRALSVTLRQWRNYTSRKEAVTETLAAAAAAAAPAAAPASAPANDE